MFGNENGNTKKYYPILFLAAVVAVLLLCFSEKKPAVSQSVAASVDSGVRAEERKLKYLLEESEGIKDVSVMLKTDTDGKIIGVAVVCPNGEDAETQYKIIRLIRALYGLGGHQIGVCG